MYYKNYISPKIKQAFYSQFELQPKDKCRCHWCHKQGELDVGGVIEIRKLKKRIKIVSFHIDHIWPVSLGGNNELSNLVLSCQRCNQEKYNNYWGD